MIDLADLYFDLEGDIAAKEVRKQKDFTKKILVGILQYSCKDLNFCIFQAWINKLNLVSLDCATPVSTELVAQTRSIAYDNNDNDNIISTLKEKVEKFHT